LNRRIKEAWAKERPQNRWQPCPAERLLAGGMTSTVSPASPARLA
jgi:hypothetical protein